MILPFIDSRYPTLLISARGPSRYKPENNIGLAVLNLGWELELEDARIIELFRRQIATACSTPRVRALELLMQFESIFKVKSLLSATLSTSSTGNWKIRYQKRWRSLGYKSEAVRAVRHD